VSNQPEPQRHAAPEFNALPPIRKPALRDRPVPELAIRHTQGTKRLMLYAEFYQLSDSLIMQI
jgi:hypothetical protein